MEKWICIDYDGVIRNVDTLIGEVLPKYIEKHNLGLSIDKSKYDTCNLELKELCGMDKEQETNFWLSEEAQEEYEFVLDRVDLHELIKLAHSKGIKVALLTARGTNGSVFQKIHSKMFGMDEVERLITYLIKSDLVPADTSLVYEEYTDKRIKRVDGDKHHFDMIICGVYKKSAILNWIGSVAMYDDMIHNAADIEENSDCHLFLYDTLFNKALTDSDKRTRITSFSESFDKLLKLIS